MTKTEVTPPLTHRTLSGKVVEDAPPTPYSLMILGGLQQPHPRTGMPQQMFGGINWQHPTKRLTPRLRRRAKKAARRTMSKAEAA